MRIGKKEFEIRPGKCYVMGILNLTPDSFSDGGKYTQADAALRQAEKLVEEGADILDLGAESTRPGHVAVSAEEEKERLLPVLEQIRRRFDIALSIDTYKAEVAQGALEEGADLINDVWGLKYGGGEMAAVAAKYRVPLIVMYNATVPGTGRSEDVIADAQLALRGSIRLAENAGIPREKLILDPGVGFVGGTQRDLQLLDSLREFCGMGCPVLLGASRKSVIGNTLQLPVEEREEGTLVCSVLAAEAGCSFVRVHDVRSSRRALDFWEAVRLSRKNT